MGSVATSVLRTADRPVLTVRPTPRAQAVSGGVSRPRRRTRRIVDE
ncbi:hypothetical protein [Halosimplex rubrum]